MNMPNDTTAKLWIKLQDLRAALEERFESDRGATTLEYVMLAAGAAAIAIALVLAVRGVVGGQATTIPDNVNTGTTFTN